MVKCMYMDMIIKFMAWGANKLHKLAGARVFSGTADFVELSAARITHSYWNSDKRGYDLAGNIEQKTMGIHTPKTLAFNDLTEARMESLRQVTEVEVVLHDNGDIKEIWRCPMTSLYPKIENKLSTTTNQRKMVSISFSEYKRAGAKKIYG